MEELHSPQEERNRRRGIVLSIVVHVALVALALLPLLTYPDPPPGQEGIVVNLGMIDVGQGEEEAPPAAAADEEPVELPVEEEVTPPEEIETEPAPADPEPVKEREVVTTEDAEEIAFKKAEEQRKKREAEELRKQREEEEARRRAEAEARRKAEEEARKKAEEDARRKAEADKLKNEIGGLFPGKGKEGEGNTGKPGTQGDPSGDPNAKKLEGISTGSGTVGGGLSSRGVLASPKVEDDTQKQGRVVIEVCVNENGDVIGNPTYTQRGSTTSDSDLIRIAVANARKWKFSKGDVSKQCGTITYNFIVR